MKDIMSSEEARSVLRALSLDSQRFRVTRCTNQSGGCINICRTYTVEDSDSVQRGVQSEVLICSLISLLPTGIS